MDKKEIIDFFDKFSKFDGTTIKIITNENSFNLDLSFDNLFDLLSFTEEEFINGSFLLTQVDIDIITYISDMLINIINSTCKIENLGFNLYTKSPNLETKSIRSMIRDYGYGYEILSFDLYSRTFGSKIKDVLLYNFDNNTYDKVDFNKPFLDCYYL